MTDHTGEKLGDYKVTGLIGAGGMGEVYVARHVHLRKDYAVKVLPRELEADEGFVARFFDEARVMAELDHPGIVRVHYMGRTHNAYFLVMEYVVGPEGKPLSLQEHLRVLPEGRVPKAKALQWAIEIADALAYAHARGVIHRDIKPGNVLIDPEGRAMVSDFGLAKAIGADFIASQIHQSLRPEARAIREKRSGGKGLEDTLDVAKTLPAGSGSKSPSRRGSSAESILGTFDYMAPEQRGEGVGTGEVDARSDIYSFGVMLYRMLTGRRPVGLSQPPSGLVPSLSKKWDRVLANCLAHDPGQRYQSATLLLADLRKLDDGSSRKSRTPARKAAVVLMAFLSIAVLVAVGMQLYKQHQSDVTLGQKQSMVQIDVAQSQSNAPHRLSPPGDALANSERSEQHPAVAEKQPVSKPAAANVEPAAPLAAAPQAKQLPIVVQPTPASKPTVDGSELVNEVASQLQSLRNVIEVAQRRELAAAARAADYDASAAAQAVNAEVRAPEQWWQAVGLEKTADDAFARNDYPAAASAWQAAQALLVTARQKADVQIQNERASATRAGDQSAKARADAESAGARSDAADSWLAASKASEGAQASFDHGEFVDAQNKWAEAAALYTDALRDARNVASARAAALIAASKLSSATQPTANDPPKPVPPAVIPEIPPAPKAPAIARDTSDPSRTLKQQLANVLHGDRHTVETASTQPGGLDTPAPSDDDSNSASGSAGKRLIDLLKKLDLPNQPAGNR